MCYSLKRREQPCSRASRSGSAVISPSGKYWAPPGYHRVHVKTVALTTRRVPILGAIQVVAGRLQDFVAGLVPLELSSRHVIYKGALLCGITAGYVAFRENTLAGFPEIPALSPTLGTWTKRCTKTGQTGEGSMT